MNKSIIALAALFAATAQAQSGPVQRFVGSGTGAPRQTCPLPANATDTQIGAAVRSCYGGVPAGQTYTLKLQGRKDAAPPPPPPPPGIDPPRLITNNPDLWRFPGSVQDAQGGFADCGPTRTMLRTPDPTQAKHALTDADTSGMSTCVRPGSFQNSWEFPNLPNVDFGGSDKLIFLGTDVRGDLRIGGTRIQVNTSGASRVLGRVCTLPGATHISYNGAAPPACAGTPPPPPPPPSPPPPPPPPTGTALYFSDCQAGAAAGCVPGNNANPGTQAAPKQNLSGININALPAGTSLLFARNGAWRMGQTGVQNPNASAGAPLTFGDYGTGAKPLLQFGGGIGFQLGGGWGNTDNDGGYTFRNLRMRGVGATGGNTHWGFWLVQNVRDVVLDGMEIEDFGFGIESNEGAPHGVRNVTVRNSTIRRNGSMGWHATGLIHNVLAENNLFEANNFSGSFMNHAIYWGGGNGSVIRGNRFVANSEVNGVCQGGNVTMHGVIDGLLIEGNTIEHAGRAADTCGGFNITSGYTSAEVFRNVVVRGNTIINAGIGAVIADSAPGIVAEGNRSINQHGRGHTLALTYSEGDVPMTSPVVRNNTLCGAGSITNWPGATQSGNRTMPLTDPACAR